MKFHKAAQLLLVAVGLIQILGFSLNNKTIKGLGALTVASPCPIVFTEHEGIETFAHNFFIDVKEKDQEKKRIQITPELYSQFKAPYNYRNVVGAAISYGPLLPEEMRDPVLNYLFLEPGPLSQSMGLSLPIEEVSVYLKTRTAGREESWVLPVGEQNE